MRVTHKPSWWTLSVLLIAMVALLWLVATAHLTHTGRDIALLGVVVGTYGALTLWVRANRMALLQDEWLRRERELARQAEQRPATTSGRTIPLTAVQQHYLARMQADDRLEQPNS